MNSFSENNKWFCKRTDNKNNPCHLQTCIKYDNAIDYEINAPSCVDKRRKIK